MVNPSGEDARAQFTAMRGALEDKFLNGELNCQEYEEAVEALRRRFFFLF